MSNTKWKNAAFGASVALIAFVTAGEVMTGALTRNPAVGTVGYDLKAASCYYTERPYTGSPKAPDFCARLFQQAQLKHP